MIKLQIKPLSVNEAWQGKRFKTQKYKKYQKELVSLLPDLTIPSGSLKVFYEFGFSSSLSDTDNPIKPLQDVLQKRYGFDDKLIFEITARKKKVKKGEEYLIFYFEKY